MIAGIRVLVFVVPSSTHVVQLFDTIVFDIVFKCKSLSINVCKFHVNNILGARVTQIWVGLVTSNTHAVQQVDTILFEVVLEDKCMRIGVVG